MQHSKLAAKEEEGTQHGRHILRQYCNKRTQKKQSEIYSAATGTDKEKAQSSAFTVLPAHVKDSCSAPEPIKLKSLPDSAHVKDSCSVSAPEPIKLKSLPDFAHVKDSCSVSAPEPMKLKSLPDSAHVKDSCSVSAPESIKLKSLLDSELLTSQPQVIVRKFTLPPFSSAYALPIRSKKDTNFGKPKQRWKQLCNLQHEMTTTLPVARVVKMLGPSTPLAQEYLPGTLQSYAAGKLDVVNSTLQKLLTIKKVDVDSSTPSKDEGSMSSPLSPIKIKTVTAPEDTSKIDDVDVEERLDTAEEVPEVAAVAEVSSTGGTVTIGPFDTMHNNVGIVGGQFVIFQPLPRTNHVVQQEGSNSKINTIFLKSPQGATIDAKREKKVIKPFVGQGEVMSNSLKTVLLQGSVKPSSKLGRKQHGIVHENLKHSSEPTMKEQNVVWGSLKHNCPSNIKQHNVVQGNFKHSSEVPKNEENGKLENLENDTEPASKEDNVTHENLKHCLEPCSKEQNVSRGNLKTISERISKEQNIVAVHPIPHETNNLKVARDCLRDVLTVSLQKIGIAAPQQDSVQNKNSQPVEPFDKPAEDESAELKQLKQLQLEILMMKRRQNIAMQVEREVLRAKDIKLVQEVQLPARRVLLSETGTQTSLFCLVEPGRMVEMMISADKTEEPDKMVSSKAKPMTGENCTVMQKPSGSVLNSGTLPKMVLSGSGKKFVAGTTELSEKGIEKNVSLNNGMMTVSDEPDKKRVRLDVMLKSQTDSEGSAPSDIQSKQMSSDTVSVDSGIDMPNVEFHNSSQHKKINVISSNSCSAVENSKAETLRNFKSLGNTNISVRGITNLEGSNKPMKCLPVVNTEKDTKSVYDIIVQHNIAAQARKSQPKQKMLKRGVGDNENRTAPMVYFPDPDLFSTPRNTNTQEIAAKITKGLMHQAYEDWVHCSIADENGNIPLHKAVINENITLVKRQCVVLCARKSKLDIYNFDKETPLQLAVLNGNAEITQMLLSFGAQPSVKDSNGNTALHLAVLHGNLECVKVIVNTNNAKSLPLNDFNDEGYSPMHLSVLNGKVEETKCLISKGAQVNLKDAKSGRTPLFHAVEANNCDLVQLLLACDASPYEANFCGHTPLSAASEVSFACRNTTKEYSVSEGINFSSKLVSLSRGSDVIHTLDEGSNIVFGGELFEDVHMDEAHESDLVAHYCSSSTVNSNSNNPWFLND